jgi:hypothetical protein
MVPASKNKVQISIFSNTNLSKATYVKRMQYEEYKDEETLRDVVTCECGGASVMPIGISTL